MKKLCFTTGPLLAVLVFIGTVMPLRADNPAVPCEGSSIFDTEGATLCNVTFANNASPTADQLATVYKVRAQEADGSPGQALELKKQANGQYKIQLHMDYIQNNNCSGTSSAKLHWKVEFTDQSAARTGIFPELNPSGGIYELELDGKDSYSSFSVSYLGNGQTETIPCVSFKIKSSCACSSCEITGQPVSSNNEERCHIPLGVFQDATLSGGLVIEIPSLANSTASRSVVKVLSGAGITVTADSGGLLTATTDSLRAVLTKDDEEGTVTITLLNPSGNTIRTILVEWPGQNELKITNTFGGNQSTPEVTEFKITNNGLEMIRGNGMLKETKTITTLNGDRVERIKVVEIQNTNEKLVSDIENTYHHFIWGWEMVKQVIDPNTEKLTTTWTYATTQGVGQGSLQEMTRYDAYKETHEYTQSTVGTVVTTTHTIKSPFADKEQNRVSTREVDSANANQTVTDELYYVGDVTTIFSKKVTEDVPNSRIETTNFDGGHFTITETLYNATTGRPEQVTHPDGTLTTYSYTTSGGNPATITRRGARGTAGNINNVIEGTETTTVTSPRGYLISSVTTAIGTQQGMELDRQEVTSDLYGRPTLIGYFGSSGNPAWTTTKTYQGCCGDAELTETDKYGIVTTYGAPDALGRRTSTVRLGVTTSTEYDGLTTITKRNGDIIAKTIRNLAGTIHAEWGPSPQTGALVELSTTTTHYRNPNLSPNPNPHNLPAKIGTRTIREVILVADDNNVTPKQTEDSYFDGKLYESTGDLAPDTRYAYTKTSGGINTSRFFLDGANLIEPTYTQSDWAGNTIQQSHGTIVTSYAYNFVGAAPQITGQLLSTTDADGVKTLYAYNSLGERTTTALDVDNDGEIDYDDADQVTITETVPDTYTDGNTTYDVMTTTTMVYTTFGDDGTTATVSTTYQTPDGLMTWSSAPGVTGEASTTVSLGGGGDWSETMIKHDQSKSVTTYTDGLWDNTEIKDSTNATISWTSARKVDNTRGYDDFNRPTHIMDSRTGVTETEYRSNTCDVVVSLQPPAGVSQKTTFFYDHRGRRIQVDAPQSVDANNGTLDNITNTTYWPDGAVKQVSGGQTYPVSYTYDYAGRKLTMTTNSAAGNAITKWIYSTSTGQLIEKKYNYIDENNTGSGPSYSYTDAGRLETRTNARNITATQYYDLGGQLLAIDYSDATPDILYTTDRLGRILHEHQGTLTVSNGTPSMAAPARSVSYTYHPTLLKVQTETHSLGAETRSLVRAYDNIGRPEQTSVGINSDTDPTTLETTEHFTAYRYGTDGRILGIDAQNVPRFTDKNYGIEYIWRAGSISLVDSITRKGTGTSSDLKTYNLWDEDRDTLERKENKLDVPINPVTISKYTYNVNNIGQRDSVATDGTAFGVKPAWSWGYNVRGELVSANDITNNDQDLGYIYDSIGNRTATGSVYTIDNDGIETVTNSLAYTPNILNQYSVAKGITLPTVPTPAPYDLDGNLRYDGGVNKDGQTREYTWDAENRLLEVKKTSVTPAVTLVSYKYDARSRRISLTAGTMTTWYLYDDVNCIAEYTQEGSGSLTLSKTNVWGLDLSSTLQGAGGVGGLLAVTDEAGEDDPLYYPTFDGNGNVSEYLTAAGVTVAHYEYDPFGNDITPANDKGNMHDVFAYRFSTKPFDSITGWYYYLYRYYDPLTGRWPSRDPIEERGGVNLYGFVGNDCISVIDLLGMVGKNYCRWEIRAGHGGQETGKTDKYRNLPHSKGQDPDSNVKKSQCGDKWGYVGCYTDAAMKNLGDKGIPNHPKNPRIPGAPPPQPGTDKDYEGDALDPNDVLWPQRALAQLTTSWDNAILQAGLECKKSTTCCKTITVVVVCHDNEMKGLVGEFAKGKPWCGRIEVISCN